MSEQENAGGAQGDTNAAAQASEAPQSLMAAAQQEQQANPAPEASATATQQGQANQAKPNAAPKSIMQAAADGEQEGQQEQKDGVERENEEYTLTFPEGAVADPESVKVLNAVGKEFGISQEKAQELATAATEYGNRRVEAQMKHLEKGFADFCRINQEQTRAVYGEKTTEVAREALRGLDAALRTMPAVNGKQITSKDILSDPNVSAISNVPWFVHLCKTLAGYMTEQSGVTAARGTERINQDGGDVNWGV